MRLLSIVCLIALAGTFASATICAPDLLGGNAFLIDFVSHDYINVLVVIVTVSFVSVTQIHLEYSRIERRYNMRVFEDARREVNTGAILLVSMLFFSIALMVIKAEFGDSIEFQSAAHGVALLVLVASILVMYDFIRTVYVLASEEPVEDENKNSGDK